MKFLNHWIEVVKTTSINGHLHDICTTVVAHHDQISRELVVYFDTFARRANSYGPEEYSYPDWLPEPGFVRLACPAEAAAQMASRYLSDITKRVQSQIPVGRAT